MDPSARLAMEEWRMLEASNFRGQGDGTVKVDVGPAAKTTTAAHWQSVTLRSH